MTARLTALAALVVLAAAAPRAWAHAMLERANPPVGATVPASPKQLDLKFSEAVVPHFSKVEVRNAHGEAIPTGPLGTADQGHVLVVPLPPLPPGEYEVVWSVVSVDTHRTQGRFNFRVGP